MIAMPQNLTSEAVECPSLPLQGIDDIESSDGLPLGVFSVGDGITDDILKEHLHQEEGTFHQISSRKITSPAEKPSISI